jgi:cytochrome c oxidase subunit I
MAIIERPSDSLATASAAPTYVTPDSGLGVFRRPVQSEGWKSWLFTVDHKKLGIMYGVTAMAFFVIGGIEAMLIRTQLAGPNGTILSADKYNQMFTMHATTMVFLFVMPMAAAFANYMVPLQTRGTRRGVPSHQCVWVLGVLVRWDLHQHLVGPWWRSRWRLVHVRPNSSVTFSPTNGIDFWVLGLLITGIASQTGAINLIVTALNMRAPGMSLMRMPIFTWMILVVQFLLVFAIPVITVALCC